MREKASSDFIEKCFPHNCIEKDTKNVLHEKQERQELLKGN